MSYMSCANNGILHCPSYCLHSYLKGIEGEGIKCEGRSVVVSAFWDCFPGAKIFAEIWPSNLECLPSFLFTNTDSWDGSSTRHFIRAVVITSSKVFDLCPFLLCRLAFVWIFFVFLGKCFGVGLSAPLVFIWDIIPVNISSAWSYFKSFGEPGMGRRKEVLLSWNNLIQ